MAQNTYKRKDEITVDERGRTVLTRVRTGSYTHYRVTEHEDGTLVLTPVLTITPAELAEAIAQGKPAA